MSQAPEHSPNELDPNAMRRLNRVPLLIAGLLLSILLAAVAHSYYARLAKTGVSQDEVQKPEPAPLLWRDAPDGGLIAPLKEPPLPPPAPKERPVLAPEPLPQDDERRLALEADRQRMERRRAMREEAALQASLASTPVAFAAPKPAAGPTRDLTPVSQSERFAELAERLRAANPELQDRDLNRARDKRDFLSGREPQSQAQNTLAARREGPSSPYQVKAGTIIPATMVGGILSDLPGQILGQVSENVYDSASGRFVLIPQGAKLVGTYDNGVTTGQERVLVAWTRVIFPDASAIDLGKMPGADESGYAGFHDLADDHFVKTFGSAILLSVVSAGVQLSQGNGHNQTGGLTSQQTIAAALGQQLGQLGQETARRNMQVQPTLEIRPGYRFTVMVTKDIMLRPWLWPGTRGAR